MRAKKEFYEEGQFLLAIISNLESEIDGVKELEGLELKKKVRIIAFLNLFYECLNASMGDEDEDDFDDEEDDFEDDNDEDFEDDEEEETQLDADLKDAPSKIQQLSPNKKKSSK